MSCKKYKPFGKLDMSDRTWPDKIIEKAPVWCSVGLRDGNQSLEVPMTLQQKLDYFRYLVAIGFKEIEIGFPAASETEFQFARTLIESNLIPDDVTIQVLTQAREEIIKKTFDAIRGAKSSVIHLYNSTSTLQREVVFQNGREETIKLAVAGAKLLKRLTDESDEEGVRFEYSPESFTGTELDFAVDICNEIIDIFKPTKEKKLIINLPATVEMSTPNIYADQIEYMCRNIKERDKLTISLHTHNDRGTGVAATELALMAGADRVEGTLFGNGERTGNVDIITLAMNLYSQGINPELDFSNIDKTVEVYEKNTGMKVHERHPYAGSLVYTAFSGSHQDAIRKGMKYVNKNNKYWEVPYLPINPLDVGRSYDPIIRINSQSGKGGVAFILEQKFGLEMPKRMQQDFSLKVTGISDTKTKELTPEDLYNLYKKEYINLNSPMELVEYIEENKAETTIKGKLKFYDKEIEIEGEGEGLIEAFADSLINIIDKKFEVKHYNEHSLEIGSKSRAITYIELITRDNKSYFGAGVSRSVSKSSLKALISCLNKTYLEK